MSIHISSAVWKRRGLDPMTKLVLLKLADNANDEGECWPSIRRIVNETGLAKATVCNKLRDLEAAGLIERQRRETDTARTVTTLYWLNVAEISKTSDDDVSATRTGPPAGPLTSPPRGHIGVHHTDPNHNIRTIKIEPSLNPLSATSLVGAGILLDSELALDLPDYPTEIYNAYPRKVGRKAALAAIERAMRRIDPGELLDAVKHFARAVLAARIEERFIPHPATWFNQDRWTDPMPQPNHGPRDASSLTSDEKQRF